MSLIVQKYGGTSVGTPERIRAVARRVARYKSLGHQVVVVVSAMSGETNRLIGLAKEIMEEPDTRELDVMVYFYYSGFSMSIVSQDFNLGASIAFSFNPKIN